MWIQMKHSICPSFVLLFVFLCPPFGTNISGNPTFAFPGIRRAKKHACFFLRKKNLKNMMKQPGEATTTIGSRDSLWEYTEKKHLLRGGFPTIDPWVVGPGRSRCNTLLQGRQGRREGFWETRRYQRELESSSLYVLGLQPWMIYTTALFQGKYSAVAGSASGGKNCEPASLKGHFHLLFIYHVQRTV